MVDSSLSLPSGTVELCQQIGLATVPMTALAHDISTGTLRLRNEPLQHGYFESLRRRLERRCDPPSPSFLRASERYQEMLQATVVRIAEGRIGEWATGLLASATRNSLLARNGVFFPASVIVAAISSFQQNDVAILRLYAGICIEGNTSLSAEGAGYRLGEAASSLGILGPDAEGAVRRLQELEQIEPGTEVALDVGRAYLPARRLTTLGCAVLELLDEEIYAENRFPTLSARTASGISDRPGASQA